MTCAEIADFLMDYLNAELPEDARKIFEEHLTECPECVDYLHSYEMTIQMGQSAYADPPNESPEELIQAILAARKRM